MSEHLDKAKGALAAARDILEQAQADSHGLVQLRDAEEFNRKLGVASAQANIAQAEALERIAELLDTIVTRRYAALGVV